MSGQHPLGPTCGSRAWASLNDGTMARWWSPAPRPAGLYTPWPRARLTVAPGSPATVPDVGYLFNSCRNPQRGLSDADFAAAAATLGVDVAAIRAVAEVESPRGAFDDHGRPSILYERHYFRRLTARRHDRTHPDISGPRYLRYGRYAAQYGKLERAYALDRTAALKSASWGRFQIMGANHLAAGYPTVQAMVEAMARSESAHLQAFVHFIQADARLLRALQRRDWAAFARRYNGSGYAANQYDVKLAQAYERLSETPTQPEVVPPATPPATQPALEQRLP